MWISYWQLDSQGHQETAYLGQQWRTQDNHQDQDSLGWRWHHDVSFSFTRLTLNSVEAASQIEELIVPIEAEKKDEKVQDSGHATPMETDDSTEDIPAETEIKANIAVPGKTKKIIKKHDLSIVAVTTATSHELLSTWMASEGEMQASDRLVIDTADRRNALEEYVYDVRSKLEMAWSEFILDADRTVFMKALNDMEEWLYGEGEDATKSVYVEKLNELKKLGDPVAMRYLQNEERSFTERKFRDYVNSVILLVQSGVCFNQRLQLIL